MPVALVATDSGMAPFNEPINFAVHNKGVRCHFFTRSDPIVIRMASLFWMLQAIRPSMNSSFAQSPQPVTP
jgi:hypothetical protein